MALLQTSAQIDTLIPTLKTIAVLGIKTDPRAAAHYVPAYAQQAGIRVIPVPVYYPEVTKMLGETVFRSVAAIGEPLDAVIVFRRSEDVPAHVDDLIAAKPRVVWMQSGIRNDDAAKRLSDAGIDVVQDHCLMVELQERGR